MEQQPPPRSELEVGARVGGVGGVEAPEFVVVGVCDEDLTGGGGEGGVFDVAAGSPGGRGGLGFPGAGGAVFVDGAAFGGFGDPEVVGAVDGEAHWAAEGRAIGFGELGFVGASGEGRGGGEGKEPKRS